MNKKLFFLILIPALVIIGFYIYIRYSLEESVTPDGGKNTPNENSHDSLVNKKSTLIDLRPLFIQRLQQLIAKTSDNIYALSVDSMTVDILSSSVSFRKVVLTPDKKRADSLNRLGLAPAETFAFSFEKLQVEGINLDDAIREKTMDYKLVKLTNPVFHIYRAANDAKDPREDFTQRFLKEMQKLSVQHLVVEGGQIIIHNKGRSTILKEVMINMKDILIDSSTRKDPDRFLFAKKASLSFKDYEAATSKGEYKLAIAAVNIEVPEQKITLTDLSFSPPVNKKEFSRRQKISREYYQVAFPLITISAVNWWNLLNEDEVSAKEIAIEGGKLFIYLDRSLPRASKMGNFPVQLLMKLPVKMDIERLKLNKVHLAYEEYNPLSRQSGTIHINDISMNVTDVSNKPGKRLKPVVVQGKGSLMGKVPLNANFVFSREKYKSGKFTAAIRSDNSFDGSAINPFGIPLGLVEIEKGELQKITADITGDELQASGDITILYKDLKLGLLEKDVGSSTLDKKSVTSFFANTFVIKKDNLNEGEEPRKVEAEFKRIREGGFFLLVWKTILTGALKTIGAPTKIANKTATVVE